ncbi:MAG: MATE family efflux transporter [Acetobacteraceae bacterium]
MTSFNRGIRPQSLGRHLVATVRLAAPLVVALLAQMAMGVTDTMLLGDIGGDALAAGGLGGSLFITALVTLQGVLAAVSVLVAQARGARRDSDVPALYWTGFLLAGLLAIPAFALFSAAEPLLLLVGEPDSLAHDVDLYVSVLRWSAPGALLEMGLLRAFLPAIGGGATILWVTILAAIANALLCYGLIHGVWVLPALGLRGAALATVIVPNGMAIALLAMLHLHPTRRRFATWARPRWDLLLAMIRLGVPVGATFAVETGLFLAVALLIGLLGPAALAAQQVALNALTVAFMVPFGIAQAANVRVGNHVGAGDGPGARRAGLVAIGLGAACELMAALLNLLAPRTIVTLHLGPAETEAFATAVSLLGVASVFQVADGVQSVAGGALRGLGDTRVPFALAAFGYWGIGFPAAWWLTMRAGLGPAGSWWGLAAGLIVVAILMTSRFLRSSRHPPAPLLAG